jgi:tRNA threonylcarbamoyladenosine biosynthesis protein TsaE
MLQILHHFVNERYICRMEMVVALEDIDRAATGFLELAKGARVFAVSGQMGAGKTTFISAVCRALGASGALSSPTFSIINEYQSPGGRLLHIDLYRLRDEEEARQAGVEDALYAGDYCFVEWPEKAPELFPDGTMNLSIEALDETTRKLSLTIR